MSNEATDKQNVNSTDVWGSFIFPSKEPNQHDTEVLFWGEVQQIVGEQILTNIYMDDPDESDQAPIIFLQGYRFKNFQKFLSKYPLEPLTYGRGFAITDGKDVLAKKLTGIGLIISE